MTKFSALKVRKIVFLRKNGVLGLGGFTEMEYLRATFCDMADRNTVDNRTPDYLFEASWEVCNKVGGIYTVLSTHAKSLMATVTPNVLFVGPDLWCARAADAFGPAREAVANDLFVEDSELYADWVRHATLQEGLPIRAGRWNIPGNPVAILVDFLPFHAQKNEIYSRAWERFSIDSLHGYGDYDEASMFSYAAAMVAESFIRFVIGSDPAVQVVYHAHEWMTALGALVIQYDMPRVATVFTTHATTIGRSIAGNGKPLYDCMPGFYGDQMAEELNVQSKHSVEKQAAHRVDCFTTVSAVTDDECAQLLERRADVVLPNGFEDDFVPKGSDYVARRRETRKLLLEEAGRVFGRTFTPDTPIISTGGRYEFRNKGYDLLLDALHRLGRYHGWNGPLERDIVVFIHVPHFHGEHEQVGHVFIVYEPYYLTGADSPLGVSYYDALIGDDLAVFPSYYEPWGYTPLEACAFRIPTITSDLSGFGRWALGVAPNDLKQGISVLHRTDGNYREAVEELCDQLLKFSRLTTDDYTEMRIGALTVAKKALWKEFITYYKIAYAKALKRKDARVAEEARLESV